MSEKKILVCRSLTSVVRSLGESSGLDPKAFFLMLSSNYEALQTEDALDGARLHEAMLGSASVAELDWLFLGFEKVAAEKGFTILLPPHLQAMSLEEKAASIDVGPRAIPTEALVSDDMAGEEPPSLSLSTDDLAPVVTDDRKKEIVQLVAKCMHEAPVGAKLDKGQFIYQLDQNIDQLLDGESLNLDPVIEGLRQLDDVSDSDLYVGVSRLQEALLFQGISLKPIVLQVDDDQKEALMRQFEAEQERRMEAAIPATPSSTTLKKPTEDVPQAPVKQTTREKKLKDLGLGKRKRVPVIVRYGILLALFAGLAAAAYLTRPNRPLNATGYEPFPLLSASLDEGAFTGVVDQARWDKLTVDERKAVLEALQVKLRSEGRIIDAQVRNAQQDLVVIEIGLELRGSTSFVQGEDPVEKPEPTDTDSESAPPPDKESPKDSAPGEDAKTEKGADAPEPKKAAPPEPVEL